MKNLKVIYRLVSGLLVASIILLSFPNTALAATTKFRQEINITDSYLYAGSGSYATSSEIVAIVDTNYTAPAYYFEVVASSTSGTTGTVKLVNATSSATVATITMTSGNTYTRYRSNAFLPTSSSTIEYKIVLGNEAFGKGITAARVIVIQSADPINSTETQIEIGSATTSANNTTSLPLQSPKYWYYDSTKWDGSPTFYAEVTYQTNPVASSTTYNTSATTTNTFAKYIGSTGVGYAVVETWGAGGGGDGVSSAPGIGGGGGGGGAYARGTTTPAAASTNILGMGGGGAEGINTTAASSTYTGANGEIVRAAGGTGANGTTGGAGGVNTSPGTIGGVVSSGGAGGTGHTDSDVGGGGGGAGGSDGDGITASNAASTVPSAGGRGDNNLGGVGGAAGTGDNDTCANADGKAGSDNTLGGGGGGGADGDGTGVCVGGSGGRPGGGGGGSDEGVAQHLGGPGRIILTEYIGMVGVALEKDDGSFGSWTFVSQIVTAGKMSTTSERVRSVSFTPQTGRNYRITASTTNSTASYNIYNAKIVVDQVPKLEDSYSEANAAAQEAVCADVVCGQSGVSQSFTSTGGNLSSAKFYLSKTGSPTGNSTAKLYTINNAIGGGDDKPSGAALATSDNVSVATFGTSFALVTFSFSGVNQYAMTNGTSYVISYEYSGGDASNFTNIGEDNTSPTHTGNTASSTSGTWTANSAFDTAFYVYGSFNPTFLQPQYLLANTLVNATGLSDFDTLYDSAEWANTTNTYIHQIDSSTDTADSAKLQSDPSGTPTDITNSTATGANRATSTNAGMTMPSGTAAQRTMDVNVLNVPIYSSRILVDVAPPAAAPTVTTSAATGVGVASAILNGNITATGGTNATVRGFAWGTDSTLSSASATTTESGDFGVAAFTQNVSGLLTGKIYYFRAYATNTNGTGYGTILNFTAGTDTSVSRRLLLFGGFAVKFFSGKIILHQQ